jgi:hypothetical protein
MLRSKGVLVLDLSSRVDLAVAQKFCHEEKIELRRADVLVEDRAEHVREPVWGPVEHLFATLSPPMDAVAVEMDEPIAAMVTHSDEQVLADLVARAREAGGADPLLDLLSKALAGRRQSGKLLINVRHPLIQQVREAILQGADWEQLRLIAAAVAASARMLSEKLSITAQVEALEAQSQVYQLALQAIMQGKETSPEERE